MITYLIRQDSDWEFTVTKWNGEILPIAEYRVTIGKSKWNCNCPSGGTRGYCKHPGMVKDWIKNGMPVGDVA